MVVVACLLHCMCASWVGVIRLLTCTPRRERLTMPIFAVFCLGVMPDFVSRRPILCRGEVCLAKSLVVAMVWQIQSL